MNEPSLKLTLAAASVHVLTATGAIFALLALLAAADGNWQTSFIWLGVALIVDGIDGPLARRFRAKQVLPRFSGEDLDHVIDYLTYVAIPAFMVARADIVPAELRVPLASAIMFVSLYHFADTRSKTYDGYFVGFPAIWNIIVFYCFALALPQIFNVFLIAISLLLIFIPLKWVHPVRVTRLRLLTLPLIAIWASIAVLVLLSGFPAGVWERVLLVGVGVYLIAVGLTGGKVNG